MKRAFTLVELMLVIVIISILGSIVVPRLAGRAEKARQVAAKADVEANLPAALDMYDMDVGEYPQNLQDLVEDSGADNWAGPYLKKLPRDPWGKDYYYKNPGDRGLDYDLASLGRDGTLGSEDDVVGW